MNDNVEANYVNPLQYFHHPTNHTFLLYILVIEAAILSIAITNSIFLSYVKCHKTKRVVDGALNREANERLEMKSFDSRHNRLAQERHDAQISHTRSRLSLPSINGLNPLPVFSSNDTQFTDEELERMFKAKESQRDAYLSRNAGGHSPEDEKLLARKHSYQDRHRANMLVLSDDDV
jgi:hypothetical protein